MAKQAKEIQVLRHAMCKENTLEGGEEEASTLRMTGSLRPNDRRHPETAELERLREMLDRRDKNISGLSATIASLRSELTQLQLSRAELAHEVKFLRAKVGEYEGTRDHGENENGDEVNLGGRRKFGVEFRDVVETVSPAEATEKTQSHTQFDDTETDIDVAGMTSCLGDITIGSSIFERVLSDDDEEGLPLQEITIELPPEARPTAPELRRIFKSPSKELALESGDHPTDTRWVDVERHPPPLPTVNCRPKSRTMPLPEPYRSPNSITPPRSSTPALGNTRPSSASAASVLQSHASSAGKSPRMEELERERDALEEELLLRYTQMRNADNAFRAELEKRDRELESLRMQLMERAKFEEGVGK
ncbi:hypothetical protein HK104_000619 [Borealophlyctis nickersoniae]|nr:hypothetical protein HK104_000619 [Borealophlyctis nickersoniae]